MAQPNKTAGASLITLLAGIPPNSSSKNPESPLLKSLALLSETRAQARDELAGNLWVPSDPQVYTPFYDQNTDGLFGAVGGGVYPAGVSSSGVRTQPSPRPPTLSETMEALGSAVRNIPETVNAAGAALRTIGSAIARGFDWIDRHLPRGLLDPHGRLVPRWNIQLYLLARRAYQGDFRARAAFLDEIGADKTSADDVLFIDRLLEPTFNPRRVDRRYAWEQEPPEAARKQLRKRLQELRLHDRLEEKERYKGEREYEHLTQLITPSELAEVEHRVDERILYERLRAALPEQQFMFFWYRSQGLKYEEIAAEMGISLSTVKTHARGLKGNRNFRGALGR